MSDLASSDTVHVVVGWNDEYENAYVYEAPAGEAEDRTDAFEGEIPVSLWNDYQAAVEACRVLRSQITALLGFDEGEGRMAACCSEWHGHESPGHVWWGVMLRGSGNQNEWPTGDGSHHVWSARTREAAEALIASWPAEFYMHYGAHRPVHVTRGRFVVERGEYRPTVSACTRCGWTLDEHPAPPSTATDSPAALPGGSVPSTEDPDLKPCDCPPGSTCWAP